MTTSRTFFLCCTACPTWCIHYRSSIESTTSLFQMVDSAITFLFSCWRYPCIHPFQKYKKFLLLPPLSWLYPRNMRIQFVENRWSLSPDKYKGKRRDNDDDEMASYTCSCGVCLCAGRWNKKLKKKGGDNKEKRNEASRVHKSVSLSELKGHREEPGQLHRFTKRGTWQTLRAGVAISL